MALLFQIPVLIAQQIPATETPLQVSITGSGSKSLVFIPGFACSGEVWNETITRFKDNYTCYVFTMPGFAGAPPQGNPSFIAWTKQITGYIESSGIKNPIIIGHSLGGLLAMSVAASNPGKIARIMVVDALPCLAALYNPSFKTKENPDCSAIIKQVSSMEDKQFYQVQLQTAQLFTTDSMKQKRIAGWSVTSDRHTFGQLYCDFSNLDLREELKRIDCPSLVLLEPSFKSMSAQVEAQYHNLKNTNLHYAGKGLHFIMYDDREWFDKELAEFTK